MKKVVCIYDSWESINPLRRLLEKMFGRNKPDPIEGHIYTVVEEKEGYYILAEFSKDEQYRVEGFRPVIDLEESFEEVTYEEVRVQKPISVN